MESFKTLFAYVKDRALEWSTWKDIVLAVATYIAVPAPACYVVWTVAALGVLMKDGKFGGK